MVEAQVQWSADGRWWWDGRQWQPAPQYQPAPPRTRPEQLTQRYRSAGQLARAMDSLARYGWQVSSQSQAGHHIVVVYNRQVPA